MRYEISFYEDVFTLIDSVVVDVVNESELKQLADNYFEENLDGKFEVAGCKWHKISD